MRGDVSRAKDRMLGQRLKTGSRLNVALSVLSDAGASLARMHKEAWLHRDIKPENLFVDGHGRVRLGDLGLAASCAHGSTLSELSGTLAFLAPEQWYQRKTGHASDVWSLGVTFAEVLTGSHPFEHAGLQDIPWQQRPAAFATWHRSQPRTAEGRINVSGLLSSSRRGPGAYFAEVYQNYGPSTTSLLLDELLHPQPEARSSAAQISGWAEAKLSDRSARAGGPQGVHQLLAQLAAPPAEWDLQRLALRYISEAERDGADIRTPA